MITCIKHFETRKAMDTFSEGECDFLRKTVVLFIVSRAIRQAPLLSEPSQLPSQLLTGILNQQLMCAEICPPPHGPNACTRTHILTVCLQHAFTPSHRSFNKASELKFNQEQAHRNLCPSLPPLRLN